MSNVFIKTDSENRVVGLDGGYTASNITDPENWTLIDEGEGDKYNLCQTHYLPEPLYNDDAACLWKLVGTEIVHRTAEEIAADTPEPPTPGPTMEERVTTLEGNMEDLLNGTTE